MGVKLTDVYFGYNLRGWFPKRKIKRSVGLSGWVANNPKRKSAHRYETF